MEPPIVDGDGDGMGEFFCRSLYDPTMQAIPM